jgi:hypothetical protein
MMTLTLMSVPEILRLFDPFASLLDFDFERKFKVL